MEKIKITKRIHPAYKGYGCNFYGYEDFVGKWQYFYEGKKGMIDLVSLPNYYGDGKTVWEIYSKDIDLKDMDRFSTKKEAEKYIRKVLGGKNGRNSM